MRYMKWIAVLLMVIDHIGYYFDEYLPREAVFLLRLLGRLAFPLFAYTTAAGYQRTSNKTKYIMRMLYFAFITQILLTLMGFFTGQNIFVNVLFTFALSLATLVCLDGIETVIHRNQEESVDTKISFLGISMPGISVGILSVLGLLIILILTFLMTPDYHLFGIASVVFFYYVRRFAEERGRINQANGDSIQLSTYLLPVFLLYGLVNLIWVPVRVFLLGGNLEWSLLQIFSALAVFLLPIDHRREKKKWEKYFFYFFYPVHILLFMFLRYTFQKIS